MAKMAASGTLECVIIGNLIFIFNKFKANPTSKLLGHILVHNLPHKFSGVYVSFITRTKKPERTVLLFQGADLVFLHVLIY